MLIDAASPYKILVLTVTIPLEPNLVVLFNLSKHIGTNSVFSLLGVLS